MFSLAYKNRFNDMYGSADSYNSKPGINASDRGKDEKKPSVRFYPNEKEDNFGKSNTEGMVSKSLMFRDGRRRIDMVLAYQEEDHGVMTEAEARKRDHRRTFQENLINEGLELELEDKLQSFDGKTWFLKIHIPPNTEMRMAEMNGMKRLTKKFITISTRGEEKQTERDTWYSKVQRLWRKFFYYDQRLIEIEPSFYDTTASKGGSREEQFLVKDRHTQFSPAQRSYLVKLVLLRARFDTNETRIGIRRLIKDKAYLACFPLHEGRYDIDSANGTHTDRRLLYLQWARPSVWYKKQPLWLIHRYFGDKIGIYFCWVGFYTKHLHLPAFVGVLCFAYGLLSTDSAGNVPSKEICDPDGPGKITLCPLCDKACKYQALQDSCVFAKLTYLFDNPSTVFFAIFMPLWATIFLKLWKRRQAVLKWEWDLHGVDKEAGLRPEFEESVKTFRTNPVTKEKEPYMPTCRKGMRYAATSSAVLFMIALVMSAVLGVIIYRKAMVPVIYKRTSGYIQQYAKIFTILTAALLNLIVILVLCEIYKKVAVFLTNLENPRTQMEYENSFTFKVFLFEILNFYSTFIYIAFFKGHFYHYPGDDEARKSELFMLKADICDPAGCLSELCILLAIIMVGKQILRNAFEAAVPIVHNWWRHRAHKAVTKDFTKPQMPWERDYHLRQSKQLELFEDYLDMVSQYGFVTLFGAAFPLTAMFALLNNFAETRLDAYKNVAQGRRPFAERVEDIGAWYGILKGITNIAIVSNAFVIAYTTDFIPRMVYKFVYSPDHSLEGYIYHSLSIFNTSHYKDSWGWVGTKEKPATCSYRGYRNPPDDPDPYGLSRHYWHVFAARLAFVVVFEHIVFGLSALLQFLIPDVPADLKKQIYRESVLVRERKHEHASWRLSATYRQVYQKNENNTDRPQQRGQRAPRDLDGVDEHMCLSYKILPLGAISPTPAVVSGRTFKS